MSSLGFLNPLNSSTFTRENKNPEFGLGNPFFSFLKKPFTDNKYFPAGTSYLKSEYCMSPSPVLNDIAYPQNSASLNV